MRKEYFTNTKLLEGQIALFYLGQVGFIIKCFDQYILIDGYLSDYVDRNCCREGVTWVRNYPAPIAPEELDFVDYVFCSHAHCDHMDPDTLSRLSAANRKAKFYVSTALTEAMTACGVPEERIVPMECGKTLRLSEAISVMAIPSAHEELHRDEKGNYLETGFRFWLGDIELYHGGDGCPYEGLEEALTGCHILMLPVNGRDYYRTHVQDIIGNFDSTEAAILTKRVGADLLIPMHFDLYDINRVSPAEFVDRLYTVEPRQKFHIFAPGERFIYGK